MKAPLYLFALGACVALLGACDKARDPLPTPMLTQPSINASGATSGAVANPAVPSAESVLPPLNDPALGETDGTRKPKEASDGELMPGQNNDHSAPVSPAAQ